MEAFWDGPHTMPRHRSLLTADVIVSSNRAVRDRFPARLRLTEGRKVRPVARHRVTATDIDIWEHLGRLHVTPPSQIRSTSAVAYDCACLVRSNRSPQWIVSN